MNKRIILLLAAVFLVAGGIPACRHNTGNLNSFPVSASPAAVSSTALEPEPSSTPYLVPEDLSSIQVPADTVPVDTIPGSITALVNRNYLLPSGYIPSDLKEPDIRFSFNYQNDKRKLRKEAADALEKMFQAAEKKNIILYGVSGYRSYARQKQIYSRNVSLYGKKATDTVSAMPGSSEHQTGLTIDISSRSVGYLLDKNFGNTSEGKWVSKNAHKYGYIIRYPEGKSKITGYHYEPWHIRYVGKDLAAYLYKRKLTLEEYYGVSCNKDEKETGIDVEDSDKVKYDSIQPEKKSKTVSGSSVSGKRRKQ